MAEETVIMVTHESPFGLGDKVHIDGNLDLVAVVTAVLWRVENPQVEVSW